MAYETLKGNQYGLALKDPEIRQKAYLSFCKHLADGNSINTWYFEEGDNLCSYKTILKYIEDNPNEFPSIKKEIAEIKGYQYWESVCKASAVGSNKDANTASLQMIMRNKYGWDKKEESDSKGATTVIIHDYAKAKTE